MQVGILGGTGPAGSALAVRLGAVGVSVRVGSRQADRAATVVAGIVSKWPGRALDIEGVGNEDACRSELVVLAAPWAGATSLAASLAPRLSGKVVVTMVNALEKVGDEIQPLVPPRGSMAVAIQHALPESLVAGAFHHVPARSLGRLDGELDADVLVCSDHAEATSATIELVELVPGLRGIDAGSLSAAAAIEAFTAVLIGINITHRAHASVRLTGLGHRSPAGEGGPGEKHEGRLPGEANPAGEGGPPGGRGR